MQLKSTGGGVSVVLTEPEAESLTAFLDCLAGHDVASLMGRHKSATRSLVTLRELHQRLLQRESPSRLPLSHTGMGTC